MGNIANIFGIAGVVGLMGAFVFIANEVSHGAVVAQITSGIANLGPQVIAFLGG